MNRRHRVPLSVSLAFLVWTSAGAAETDELLRTIAEIRSASGLTALQTEKALDLAAESHAEELMRRGVLSHVDDRGGRVHDRYRRYGGTGFRAGEILAAGPDVGAVVDGWTESPTHRAVLLSPRWRRMGGAIATMPSGRIVAVVVFSDSLWMSTSEVVREEGSLWIEGRYIGDPAEEKPRLRVRGREIEPEDWPGVPSRKELRFVIPIPDGYGPGDVLSTMFLIQGELGPKAADTLFLTIPR